MSQHAPHRRTDHIPVQRAKTTITLEIPNITQPQGETLTKLLVAVAADKTGQPVKYNISGPNA